MKSLIKTKSLVERLRNIGVSYAQAGAEQHDRLLAAEEIERLRAELDALKAQEPLGWITDDYENDFSATTYTKTTAERWRGKGWTVEPIFKRPIPPAPSVPDFSDAYQGAMEEVAIWKKRALEAEELNRMFISEINGPTHMGEPAPSVPEGMKVTRGFRWDSERQHHIPTLLIEFSPVQANEPNDSKGWQDRDAVAAMLAAAPKPEDA